jgi:hypothetical protein
MDSGNLYPSPPPRNFDAHRPSPNASALLARAFGYSTLSLIARVVQSWERRVNVGSTPSRPAVGSSLRRRQDGGRSAEDLDARESPRRRALHQDVVDSQDRVRWPGRRPAAGVNASKPLVGTGPPQCRKVWQPGRLRIDRPGPGRDHAVAAVRTRRPWGQSPAPGDGHSSPRRRAPGTASSPSAGQR